MKVILYDDVEKLGHAGDVVDVKPGYARNYLIPRGLAHVATSAQIKHFEQYRKHLAKKRLQEKDSAQIVAAQLQELTLRFALKAGEQDRLFGSVTTADIADKLREQGFKIDKKAIMLEENIKRLGMYSAHVRLHPDVTAVVKVLVEKEAE
ncbi:MAG: 50S ribosomal protein L9 [Candidatus Sumerlaeia bacterium]